MVVRDRTKDFREVADQSFRAKSKPGDLNHHNKINTNNNIDGSQRSPKIYTTKFGQEVANIGRGIHETAGKLNKLSKLAKIKSLFNDPALEIQDLTYVIKRDITLLTQQIGNLSNLINAANQQTKKNSDNIISTLQAKLAATTADFRKVLEIRTKTLKEQQQSRSDLGSTPFTTQYSEAENESSGELAIPMPQLQRQVRRDFNYNQGRLEAVQSIESTIVELEGIFRNFAVIVQEQGEMIERIDANVDDTVSNLSTTKDQLMKYMSNLSSSRSLTYKVFGVLAAFIFFFVVVFV